MHFLVLRCLNLYSFEMYNYLINFRPGLLGGPLQLGALSALLVRLWVNPALIHRETNGAKKCDVTKSGSIGHLSCDFYVHVPRPVTLIRLHAPDALCRRRVTNLRPQTNMFSLTSLIDLSVTDSSLPRVDL